MDVARTKKLALLRHAKSGWPDDVPDHERPLAPRGRRDAPLAGRWLRLANCVPDRVLCSTARRARETWQLAEAELGVSPPVDFGHAVYEASSRGLLGLIRQLPPAARTVLLVGHAPGVPDLALTLAADDRPGGRLAAGSPSWAYLDRMRGKFPTAAIAVLEFGGPWSGLAPGGALLVSFVTPRDLEADHGGRRP